MTAEASECGIRQRHRKRTALSRGGSRFLNVLWIDLWRLFANFCRIDDELERIGVLVFFHQLQIGVPLGALQSSAVGELWLSGFDQLRCQCVLAICGETV